MQNRYLDIRSASTKELKLYISQEGKRLNQQLVEVQKRGLTGGSFAYKALADRPSNREFLGVSKSGKLKINLNTRGKDRAYLQKLAGVINRSISYKTLTISGLKGYYQRVFKTLRGKEGYEGLSKLSDAQLSDILNTEGWESMKATVGSEQAFRMIGSANSAEKIVDFLESTGGGMEISNYVSKFNKEVGAEYVWEPAINVPFTD